ncbi:MAG: transketolase C-terminal domain-containing protein [Bryobacteraceae bacterium]
MRQLTFAQAIREAVDLAMERDPNVYIMGLGVPDPRGIFGTTLGLREKYGASRAMDTPTSENAMTGIAIGSALCGMRPIVTHQRVDFALLAVEQVVNQAAKWHYMFGGRASVPLVIRLIVGRGWGQGAQHSQSLQAWFAHVPGLKVVMPANAQDAKGLLISGIYDNNPVIYLEHRWLHETFGVVPEGIYTTPIGKAHIARPGSDLTVVATSYAVVEALRCAEVLARSGVQAEVVDVRTLRPWDKDTVLESVLRTGCLMVADTGWITGGFGGEVLAVVAELAWGKLKCPPRRFGMADCPMPTSSGLSRFCYARPSHLYTAACEMLGVAVQAEHTALFHEDGVPHDAPDRSFKGPF